MYAFITRSVDAVSQFSVIELAVRATIPLAIAGLVSLLCRRRSAADRHRIWLLGLIGCIAVPCAGLWLPELTVAVLPARTPVAQAVPSLEEPPADLSEVRPGDSAALTRTATPSDDPPHSEIAAAVPVATASAAQQTRSALVNPEQILIALWLAGATLSGAVFFLALFLQAWRIGRFDENTDSGWQETVQKARSHLGLRRSVRTLVADAIEVPATVGIFRPQLLIPSDWKRWSNEQRDCIVLHELAHVQRWDVATQCLARLAVVVYWFNPLTWYAAARLRVERELAADDRVLETGFSASSYAVQLLLTVKRYRPQRAALGVAMAHSARLDDRVRAILEPGTRRNGISRVATVVGIAVAGLASVAIGAVSLATAVGAAGSTLAQDPAAPVWKELYTFRFQKTLPTSVVFAPDGKTLLTARATGKLMNLNMSGDNPTYNWTSDISASHPVAVYSQDGKFVYATANDGVVVLDSKGKRVGRIEEKNSRPLAIDVFPDKPITSKDSFTQIVFGNARGYFVKTWVTGREPGSGGTIETSTVGQGAEPADAMAVPLAVDPRGRSAIMTGPIDGTGQVTGRAGANVLWAYACGDHAAGSPGNRTMPGHGDTVVSAAWSREGSLAVTGDASGRVIEWNTTHLPDSPGMQETHRRQFSGRVAALAVSPDGRRMAAYVLGSRGRVFVWNSGDPTNTLTPIHTDVRDLSGSNAYACLRFSPDGQRLAGCAGDREWLKEPESLVGQARVWELTTSPKRQPAPQLAFVNPHGSGSGAHFVIPNNNVVYANSAKRGGSLYLYDIDDGKILSLMNFGTDVRLNRLVLSTDREWMVLGRMPESAEGQEFTASILHSNLFPSRGNIPGCQEVLGLSVGGEVIAVIRGGKPELWQTSDPKLLSEAPFDLTAVDAARFSPDGSLLVISDAGQLVFWHWKEGRHERIDPGRRITSLAFSPDGKLLAEGPQSAADVQIREIDSGRVIRSLSVDRSLSVPHLSFTQGGRVLIACDNTVSGEQSQNKLSRPRIFLWDTADGSLAHAIDVPGLPQSFDVSPNELYLVSRVVGSGGSKLIGWRLDGKQVPNAPNALPAADTP